MALLGAGVAVLIMHRPTWNSLTSSLPWNLGDPALGTWILAWEWHSLLNEPSRFFEGNLFHPYGEALKYSDLILPVMPLFGVVSILSGSVIVAHNIALLTLSLFCVIATYLLARRLVLGPAVVVAAVSFSFSGYVFMHQSHIQLLTLGFFPLAFLVLFRTLDRRRVRDGLCLGLVSGLLTMASFYYAAIWFVCLILVVLIDAIRIKWPEREWWLALGTGALATAVLVAPIAVIYGSFQSRVPFAREVGGFGLSPIDLLTPPPGSILYSDLFDWAATHQTGSLVEHGFFLGFIVLALAVGGTVVLLVQFFTGSRSPVASARAQIEIGYLAAAGALSLLLAVGPELGGVTMPFALLHGLPGYNSIRAVSRLAVPALLAASVLGAWFLARLVTRAGPKARIVTVALITGAVMLELAVVPSRAPVGEYPEVRSALLASPAGAVVELPMLPATGPSFVFAEGPRLLQSIGDWRPRFNGFSGGFPPGYPEDVAILASFPDQTALRRMADLDLRYVILHGSREQGEHSFSFDELEVILGALPASASAVRYGDSWLVDLGPTSPAD